MQFIALIYEVLRVINHTYLSNTKFNNRLTREGVSTTYQPGKLQLIDLWSR